MRSPDKEAPSPSRSGVALKAHHKGNIRLVILLILVMIGSLYFERIYNSIRFDHASIHASYGSLVRGECQTRPSRGVGNSSEELRKKIPPWVNIDNGIVSYGDTSRLTMFTNKLDAGKPVVVGVVGGSISFGQGASDRDTTSWVARIFNWIRTTYPHANHTLVNGAVPATPSAYMALCWRYYVPRQPDLMIVEYNVNDGAERSTNAPIRRAHERLLRSLLSLPSSPAVIENVVMRIPEEDRPAPRYRDGGDDELGVLAQYYHIPWISTRSLMWNSMNHIEASKRISYLEWMADRDHPNDLGHALIAAMLVRMFDMAPQQTDDTAQLHSLNTPLHLPLYPNNFQVFNKTCILHGEFEQHVVASRGFTWVNEGTEAKPKFGFIGTRAGAYFRFTLNSAENSIHDDDTSAKRHSVVSIAYLASYEHMGMFNVSCPEPSSSCSCDPLIVDGHKLEHSSQLFTASIVVTKSESCILDFRIQTSTSSGEYKTKIAGVIVSPDPADPAAKMYYAVENHIFTR